MDILLVDDSRTQRMIMKKILGMTDIEIGETYQAANGLEALELLRDNKIDLIFTDINMPEMDGETMVRAIKQDDRINNIPIVVITSKGSDFTRSTFLELGVESYLVKPFTPEDVVEVVESITGGSDA